MKNVKIVLFFLFAVIFFSRFTITELNAQSNSTNYKSTYQNLMNSNKMDEVFIHLQNWEKAEKENPEMYIGWFNYYVKLGSTSGIAMGRMENGQYGTYQQINFINENVYKGIEYLDKGLEYKKNRLDMYLGKISVLYRINDYQNVGDEILKLLTLSKQIKNVWLWSDNESLNEGERFLLGALNTYYNRWMDSDSEILINWLELCTKKQIELYPQYIEAYNFLAVSYILRNDFNNAIQYFEKALKIDENDCIVLINLGRAYTAAGNNTKARECFNRALLIGNEEEKNYARSYLDKL